MEKCLYMEIKIVNKADVDYVSCNFVIPIGSVNFIDSNINTAHIIEHLIFHGHKKFNQVELLREIEDIGGIINASTSIEYTSIYLRIHKSKVLFAVKLIVDTIFSFSIDLEHFLLEEKIVEVEQKHLNKNVNYIMHAKTIESFYKFKYSYEKIDYFNICKIIKNYYGIENWILFIYGSVDNDTKKSVIEYCEKYSKIEKVNIKNNLKNLSEYEYRIFFENIDKQTKYVSYISSLNQKSSLLVNKIYRNLISNTYSSVLYQKLVEESGCCYSLVTTNNIFEFDTSIIVSSIYDGDEEFIKESFLTIKDKKYIENLKKLDLERAKQQTLCEMYLKRENIGQSAHMSIENYLKTGFIKTYDFLIDELNDMSTENIRDSLNFLIL